MTTYDRWVCAVAESVHRRAEVDRLRWELAELDDQNSELAEYLRRVLSDAENALEAAFKAEDVAWRHEFCPFGPNSYIGRPWSDGVDA